MPSRAAQFPDASLMALASRNQFFDPTGAETAGAAKDYADGEGSMGALGMLGTGFYDLGPQERETYLSGLAAKQRQLDEVGADQFVTDEQGHGSWLPKGMAEEVAASRIGRLDQEAGVGRQLKNRVANLGLETDIASRLSENKYGNELLPNARLTHDIGQQDLLDKIRAQYQAPADERAATALEVQGLKNQGAEAVQTERNQRYSQADVLRKWINDASAKGTFGRDKLGHPLPPPTELMNLAAQGATQGLTPGGGGGGGTAPAPPIAGGGPRVGETRTGPDPTTGATVTKRWNGSRWE